MRCKLSALAAPEVSVEESRPNENGTNETNQPAAVEQSVENNVDPETRRKMEFLESLGLQPINLEDLEQGNFDMSGLFPDYLLEMIEADPELCPVYQSFFTDNNFEDSDENLFPQLNNENQPNGINGAAAYTETQTTEQRPVEETEPPVKVARIDSANNSSTDGANGSVSHNDH